MTDAVDLLGCWRIERKTVELFIDQELTEPNSLGAVGAGIFIPYVSSFFNAPSVSKGVLEEAMKVSMSIREYIEDWLKTKGVSQFKAKVRSMVENELIDFLLNYFNNGYYGVNLLTDELQSKVDEECSEGWELEGLAYKGVTFDARDGLNGFNGTGGIFLANCRHHWILSLKRIVE